MRLLLKFDYSKFFVSNSRLSTGRLTYHVYNGSSTVDICITSRDLYNKIHYIKVKDPVWFSDHCQTEFSIETEQFVFEEKLNKTNFIESEQNFVWAPESAVIFSQQLGSNEI